MIASFRPLWKLSVLIGCVLLTPLAAYAALGATSGVGLKFVAKGPAGVSIVGESAQLRVSDDGQQLTFVAPLAPLKTGIDLRDKHMKEKYLEVPKFPNAELRIERSALTFPTAGQKAEHSASCELKLHGKAKRESVKYTAAHDGSGYVITATMHINMKDYGIEVPSYLGVTVKPEVEITVQFHVAGS